MNSYIHPLRIPPPTPTTFARDETMSSEDASFCGSVAFCTGNSSTRCNVRKKKLRTNESDLSWGWRWSRRSLTLFFSLVSSQRSKNSVERAKKADLQSMHFDAKECIRKSYYVLQSWPLKSDESKSSIKCRLSGKNYTRTTWTCLIQFKALENQRQNVCVCERDTEKKILVLSCTQSDRIMGTKTSWVHENWRARSPNKNRGNVSVQLFRFAKISLHDAWL